MAHELRRLTAAAASALVLALAVSGCGDDDGESSDSMPVTYAPTTADWCAELGLDEATALAGLGEVTPTEPEHTDEDGGTRTVCGAVSAPADVSPDVSTPGSAGAEDSPASEEVPFVSVQVEVDVRDSAPAPDLTEERERYAQEHDGTRDAATGEITGWWSEGVEGHVFTVHLGEDAGYATGAAVVDDNVEVEVSVTLTHPDPESYAASVDDLRERLLDLVESHLDRA